MTRGCPICGARGPDEPRGAHRCRPRDVLLHGAVQRAERGGYPTGRLATSAGVDFQPGTGIVGIRLTVSGDVPGLDAAGFLAAAEAAKAGCPVSRALSAVPITLTVE